MHNVTVLLSGGIDSSVMLALLLEQKINCSPLFINYGQITAKRELESALKICDNYSLKLEQVNISDVSRITLNQLTNPSLSKNPFFPNRNLILIVIGSMFSYEKNYNGIAIGIIKTLSYPDCTNEFLTSARELVSKSLNKEIALIAPLSNLSKFEVVEMGKHLKVPLEKTFSCIVSNIPCGYCESCKDRAAVLG